jgi:hypothetical protein
LNKGFHAATKTLIVTINAMLNFYDIAFGIRRGVRCRRDQDMIGWARFVPPEALLGKGSGNGVPPGADRVDRDFALKCGVLEGK